MIQAIKILTPEKIKRDKLSMFLWMLNNPQIDIDIDRLNFLYRDFMMHSIEEYNNHGKIKPEVKKCPPYFKLGQIVATANVTATLDGDIIDNLIRRHYSCDWGDICESDADQNDRAVNTPESGLNIHSSYIVNDGVKDHKVWVITEGDHSITTVLFPDEY